MNNLIPGICFVVMTSIFMIILYRKRNAIILTSLISACLAAVVFQVLGFFILGYWDPFFIVALIYSFFLAFVISLLIGIIIKKLRTEK